MKNAQKNTRPTGAKKAPQPITTPSPVPRPTTVQRREPDLEDLALTDVEDACLTDVEDACLTDVEDACLDEPELFSGPRLRLHPGPDGFDLAIVLVDDCDWASPDVLFRPRPHFVRE